MVLDSLQGEGEMSTTDSEAQGKVQRSWIQREQPGLKSASFARGPTMGANEVTFPTL